MTKPFPKSQQKVLTVTIDEAGDLLYLKSDSCDVLLECGEVVQRRASHVEPAAFFLRVAFHILRKVFGEHGRVAEWTRGWKVLWRVNTAPVGGPILRWENGVVKVWMDRKAAIDAEILFLNDFFLERGIA